MIDKTTVHMQIVIDLKSVDPAWFSGQLRVISQQRKHELKSDVIMSNAAEHCATPDLCGGQRVMEGRVGFSVLFFFFPLFLSPRRAKCPAAFKLFRPHIFFDKSVVRLLRLMHISQKSFLPSFLYDLPVGHDKTLRAPLYQTESFQDNANDDKFHHPALCAFPLISLIRESRGGSRCFS